MPTYELPFSVFECVTIIALDINGKIICVRFSGHDIYFDVEYWWNGTIHVVTLTSDEIEKVKDD